MLASRVGVAGALVAVVVLTIELAAAIRWRSRVSEVELGNQIQCDDRSDIGMFAKSAHAALQEEERYQFELREFSRRLDAALRETRIGACNHARNDSDRASARAMLTAAQEQSHEIELRMYATRVLIDLLIVPDPTGY